jgi:hypothetical protein
MKLEEKCVMFGEEEKLEKTGWRNEEREERKIAYR